MYSQGLNGLHSVVSGIRHDSAQKRKGFVEKEFIGGFRVLVLF